MVARRHGHGLPAIAARFADGRDEMLATIAAVDEHIISAHRGVGA
jgi:hypothetical protein